MATETIALDDGRSVKLGRVRPKSRPQALRFSQYLVEGAVAPPASVDYSAKALASIKHMYMNDQYGCCHDADTEILTEKGWKKWPDYDGRSLLGTMSVKTGHLEFQAPVALTRKDYDGPMFYAEHKGLDFCLTPDHRMLYRPYHIPSPYVAGGAGYGDLEFGKVNALPTRCMLPGATTGFIGTDLRKIAVGRREWNGMDFLRLLSLIISDGYVGGGTTQRSRISFCCFREDRLPMVREFAARMGITEQVRKGVWVFNDAVLAEWLRANLYVGDEYRSPFKKVPDLVKVASQEQIDEFLIFFGDQHATEGSRQFYSSSRRLIDDLQELMLRVGKRGTLYNTEGIIRETQHVNEDGKKIQAKFPRYTLHEYRNSEVVLQKLKRCPTIKEDYYKGEVFCATVPNSTLVTRRNGRILISGNCVISSSMHQLGIWSGNDSDSDGVILATDTEVYSQYESICGPGDNGCVITDVLNVMKTQGMIASGKAYKIDGYVAIDWTNKLEVQIALLLFGSLKLGINLPDAWTKGGDGSTWDVTTTAIVGGHDVPCAGYNAQGVQICTWGGMRTITWAAFTSTKWLEECYVILAPEWYNNDQLAPSGVNAATLRDDLTKLAGGTIPPITPTPPIPVPVPPTPVPPTPVPPLPNPPIPVPVPPTPVPTGSPKYAVTMTGSFPSGALGRHETVTITGVATPLSSHMMGSLSSVNWLTILGDALKIVTDFRAHDTASLIVDVQKLLADLGIQLPT